MKNILIREVPSSVVEIVEKYKKRNYIKRNTEAVNNIIKEYKDLRSKVESMKVEISDLKYNNSHLISAVRDSFDLQILTSKTEKLIKTTHEKLCQ